MTLMRDDVGTGILGTAGTVELQLGSNAATAGSALVAPAAARALIEVIPYQTGNAVVTASESINTRFRMDSNDATSMIPKIFDLPVVIGGLGATTSHFIPLLQAYPCNTPLAGAERINYFAQPKTANTTATIVGCEVVYSDIGTRGAEQFYQSTTNTTLVAPAANTRSSGAVVTVTGGRYINYVQTNVGMVVMTAAQALIGISELSSTEFVNTYPQRFAIQPVGGFLGATVSGCNVKQRSLFIDEPIQLTTTNQAIISTFLTNRVLQTGNLNYNVTLGYQK